MSQEFIMLCEYTENPIGLDNKTPSFAWAIKNAENDSMQKAYRIVVLECCGDTPKHVSWDSGKVYSSECSFVVYQGVPLTSRTRYCWHVHVWDETDAEYQSQTAFFETAFMGQRDWKAKWLAASRFTSNYPVFRRLLLVEKEITRARAYITGMTFFELLINGQKVGENNLEPTWTDHDKHVPYCTLDIGGYLNRGSNALVVNVSPGRKQLMMFLLQIHIEFSDGTEQIVISDRDKHWGYYSDGPRLRFGKQFYAQAIIYDGEYIDRRKINPLLHDPSVPNESIKNIFKPIYAVAPEGLMCAQMIEPIRVVAKITPVRVMHVKEGVQVVDFGKNIVGWTRIRVKGEAGRKIIMRHAEVLYPDGTVNMENLRFARCAEEIVLAGNGEEVVEPSFTYYGFRYVQVENYPGQLEICDITAMQARNDVSVRSKFHCSDETVNKIHAMIRLTEEGNLHSVPTDCPQRDERFGWTNDATSRAEESIFNFDLVKFYRKWIEDIADTQTQEGAIADIAPNLTGFLTHIPADAVASSYLIIPWLIYTHYGDKKILADHYAGFKAWVNYKKTNSDDGIVGYYYYADWVSPLIYSVKEPFAPGNGAQSAITPGIMMSTGFYLMDNQLMAEIAHVLGKEDEAEFYSAEAAQIAKAYNDKWLNYETGVYAIGSQACQLLPLRLGIVPKEIVGKVVNNLVDDIKEKNYTPSTGNQTLKFLPEVLSEFGYTDTMFSILTNHAYPSWAYMLDNGATTVWERWEKIEKHGMNSHNHPVLGCIDSWLYRYLAGIAPVSPAFAKLAICPYVPSKLKDVEACVKTVRGNIVSRWVHKGNSWSLYTEIPWNCIADISLPLEIGGKNAVKVVADGSEIAMDKETNKRIHLTRGCGKWSFSVYLSEQGQKDACL